MLSSSRTSILVPFHLLWRRFSTSVEHFFLRLKPTAEWMVLPLMFAAAEPVLAVMQSEWWSSIIMNNLSIAWISQLLPTPPLPPTCRRSWLLSLDCLLCWSIVCRCRATPCSTNDCLWLRCSEAVSCSAAEVHEICSKCRTRIDGCVFRVEFPTHC